MIRATLCLNPQLIMHEAVAAELSVEWPDNCWHKRLDIHYTPIVNRCGTQIPLVAQEFLMLASAVVALDEGVPRSAATGSPTHQQQREFVLTMPVWERQFLSAASALEQWFGNLTGDRWHLKFICESPEDPTQRGQRLLKPSSYRQACAGSLDTVVLFDGELGAVTTVVDWLEEHPRGRLLLICHYNGKIPGSLFAQRRLLQQLQRLYPDRLETILLRVGLPDPRTDSGTLPRSQPVLLLAFALQAVGSLMLPGQPLLIPEGGGYRASGGIPYTLSTQSFALLDCCLARLPALLLQPLSVTNPLYGITTGEALAACRHPDIVRQLVPFTGVCAIEQQRVARSRSQASYCGRCLSCLSRGAALRAAGWESLVDAGTQRVDHGRPRGRPHGWSDRALRTCIDVVRATPSIDSLEQRLLLTGGRPRNYPKHCLRDDAAVLFRVLREIRAMLSDTNSTQPSEQLCLDTSRGLPAHRIYGPDPIQGTPSWLRVSEPVGMRQ